MRALLFLFGLIFLFPFYGSSAPAFPSLPQKTIPQTTFIVNFISCTNEKCAENFYLSLIHLHFSFNPVANFTTDFLPGTIFESQNASAAQLMQIPNVGAVYNAETALKSPEYEARLSRPNLGITKYSIDRHLDKRQPPIRVLPFSNPVTQNQPVTESQPFELYSTSLHATTGVQRLHQAGYLGTGTIIAVIDAEMDFGSQWFAALDGTKVNILDSFDFVSESSHPTLPEFYDHHGLLVAGIAVGSDGVAPEADLLLYTIDRDLGPQEVEMTPEQKRAETVSYYNRFRLAIARAHEHGAHVINLSLSTLGSWTDEPVHDALQQLQSSGIIVTAASTNFGESGAITLSDVAALPYSVGVARYNEPVTPGFSLTAKTATEERKMFYRTGAPRSKRASFHLKIEGENHSWLPRHYGPDDMILEEVSGRGISRANFRSSLETGAGGLLLYSSQHIHFDRTQLRLADKTVAILHSKADYEWLLARYEAGDAVELVFEPPDSTSVFAIPRTDYNVEMLHESSGQGPTSDLHLGLSIAAPGGSILTQTGCQSHPHAPFSGTSAASPYVAGIAALYRSKHYPFGAVVPGLSAEFKAKLETSGILMNAVQRHGCPAYSGVEAVWAQAGGQVDAWTTVLGSITITPSQLLLNDTDNAPAMHEITIENDNDIPVTVNIKHVPGPGAFILRRDFSGAVPRMDSGYCLDAAIQAEKVTLSVESKELGAKEKLKVSVTIKAPKVTVDDAKLLPLYGGWIEVTKGTSELYHVTYFGAATSMKSIQLLAEDPEFKVYDPEFSHYVSPRKDQDLKFRLQHSLKGELIVRPVIGSQETIWEYFNAAEWYPGRIDGGFLYGHALKENRIEAIYDRDADKQVIKQKELVGYVDGTWFDSASGRWDVLPIGIPYKACVRLLRILGDRTKAEDWESWCRPATVTFFANN
ncbi:subtilisin-like protein [Ascobolus immersus RN42]|uniref:Subtilisin-like protein n=1 Tax=Ascobolus immersus RN42 TaxID=1160509 RepID=A0A3N4I805_ASCIM|nr:subtilisin-like protein [Ascobolus immersus RN42]